MAKAVVPVHAFRAKFGATDAASMNTTLHDLVAQFLHEAPVVEKRLDKVRG
jgi:hypothetical protein